MIWQCESINNWLLNFIIITRPGGRAQSGGRVLFYITPTRPVVCLALLCFTNSRYCTSVAQRLVGGCTARRCQLGTASATAGVGAPARSQVKLQSDEWGSWLGLGWLPDCDCTRHPPIHSTQMVNTRYSRPVGWHCHHLVPAGRARTCPALTFRAISAKMNDVEKRRKGQEESKRLKQQTVG